MVAVILGFLIVYSQTGTSKQTAGQPAAGGYGHAPAAGGYGSAPAAGGYGNAPAAGGYGHAPAAGGYGSAPAAGGYGNAPAAGGYGHAPQLEVTVQLRQLAAMERHLGLWQIRLV